MPVKLTGKASKAPGRFERATAAQRNGQDPVAAAKNTVISANPENNASGLSEPQQLQQQQQQQPPQTGEGAPYTVPKSDVMVQGSYHISEDGPRPMGRRSRYGGGGGGGGGSRFANDYQAAAPPPEQDDGACEITIVNDSDVPVVLVASHPQFGEDRLQVAEHSTVPITGVIGCHVSIGDPRTQRVIASQYINAQSTTLVVNGDLSISQKSSGGTEFQWLVAGVVVSSAVVLAAIGAYLLYVRFLRMKTRKIYGGV